MKTLYVASVLLICAMVCWVTDAKKNGTHEGGRGRANPRHHPLSHREEGDRELVFGAVKVHLLRKSCGVQILRDFGVVEVWEKSKHCRFKIIMFMVYCFNKEFDI